MENKINLTDAARGEKSGRIPVIIVSGFLGSGKTTFIQKLIAPFLHSKRTVVLENEFGDVNFDGAALEKKGLSVVSVLAGCICCTGIGNFTGAIEEAAERFSPQLLVIEPTGVAKLSEILMQFRLPPISRICDVKQTITVVDAKNFKDLHFLTEDFYENQLISSDVAVLSKTEALEQSDFDEVARKVHDIAPQLLIVDRPWEQLGEDERETCLHYKKEQSAHRHEPDCDCDHEHGDERRHKADHRDDEEADLDRHGEDHRHDDDHDHHHHDHDHVCGCDHDDHDHDHACGCDHDHHDHDHEHEHEHVFMACSFTPTCSAAYFEANVGILAGDRLGVVLRVKGFLRAEGGMWTQVDYVPGELRMTEAENGAQGQEPKLVFIGAGLKERAIAKFLR